MVIIRVEQVPANPESEANGVPQVDPLREQAARVLPGRRSWRPPPPLN